MANASQVNQKRIELINEHINTTRLKSLLYQHGVSHNERRDLNEIFGYPVSISFQHYYDMYELSGVADRVISTMPEHCWRDGFYVAKDEEPKLSDEIRKLKKAGLFKALKRTDILARIGHFSVLFFGLPDGRKPEQEIGRVNPRDINKIYFKPYSEEEVTVYDYDSDPASPRYGMPVYYQLTPQQDDDSDRILDIVKGRKVHYTRILHAAESTLTNQLVGRPVLKPIFRRLLDLDKVMGGSAEAYFRNARGKLALEAMPDFDDTITDSQKDDLKTEAENFQHNWQDMMRLQGVTAKQLNTPHNDPMSTIKAAFLFISTYSHLPLRVLTGEGSGQLAGSEDRATLNQLTQDRQNEYCSGLAERALKILDACGVIQLPDDYDIEFPLSDPTTEKEAAEVQQIRANALSTASQAMFNLDGEMSAEQIITDVLGMQYKPDFDDGLK